MPGRGKNHLDCDVYITLYYQTIIKSLFFNYNQAEEPKDSLNGDEIIIH